MTTPLDKAVEAMAETMYGPRAWEYADDDIQEPWRSDARECIQAADDLLREHYWGELRERLLGGGGGRSHGQLHNALRSSSPLSGFAAPQPKPDEGEGSVVSGTGSSVEQDTVQGLVEALEEAHAAIKKAAQAFIVVEGTLKEPYEDDPRWSPWTRFIDRADNDAWPRLCRAEETARKALADFKAKNNTEEA